MVTFATSNGEAGFDWNRIPGVTSIHLPFDQLRARVLNVDTFSGMEDALSDEAFAGGLSQAHLNGNFGMVLHEHDMITVLTVPASRSISSTAPLYASVRTSKT